MYLWYYNSDHDLPGCSTGNLENMKQDHRKVTLNWQINANKEYFRIFQQTFFYCIKQDMNDVKIKKHIRIFWGGGVSLYMMQNHI